MSLVDEKWTWEEAGNCEMETKTMGGGHRMSQRSCAEFDNPCATSQDSTRLFAREE
jgi:hypothetical protein